jgi:signal transduction histidine kinase
VGKISVKKKSAEPGDGKLEFRDLNSNSAENFREKSVHPENTLDYSEAQLRNLSAHLHSLWERDRTRLSREINEELGQILSILKFDLDWVKENLNEDQKAVQNKVQSMSSLIASVIEWVRRISQELRPSLLDNLGLIAALEWELNEFKKRTGINCEFSTNQSEIKLDEQTSIAIFRIAQEFLNNIFMNNQGVSITVLLNVKKNWIVLTLGDKGASVSKGKLIDQRSIGFLSIQERVRYLNGRINITESENNATSVTVELPYKWDGNNND